MRSLEAAALLSADVESQELSPGSQMGNYRVHACIGRGAMASIYRAEHCLLKKQVALKVMASSLHASLEARQRFLREARAVAAIQHPNVVAIADAGLVDGVPYLVMELLEGEDLEQRLERDGAFSARELAALALPLVAALTAAHDAGVIHRDLKPGNIFLARAAGGEIVPKLLDFGISKFAGPAGTDNLAMTAFNQLMGSPLYLPPEALQGSRELTPRSDQYSLGVVLYECITGQAPFFRDDLLPLLNAISEGSCPAPRSLRPETPEALDKAILRAMSVDPLRRFEHIRDLGSALLALADLRTRHIWAPAFGSGLSSSGDRPSSDSSASGAAHVVVSGATAADAAPVKARFVRGAPQSSGRRPLWGALALLVSGSVLLVLAFGRIGKTAASVVAAPSFVGVELRPRVESAAPWGALAEPAVVQAPLALHPPVEPQQARGPGAGSLPLIESQTASSSTPATVPARPHGPGPRPAPRVHRSDDSGEAR